MGNKIVVLVDKRKVKIDFLEKSVVEWKSDNRESGAPNWSASNLHGRGDYIFQKYEKPVNAFHLYMRT